MNYIEIGGLKFCKENMKAKPNNEDIFEKNGEVYFTWDAAMREAEKQGLTIPTKEQWEQAMSSQPDYKKGDWNEAGIHLARLLGLKLSGYYRPCGTLFYGGTFGYFWSSSKGNSRCTWLMALNEYDGNVISNSRRFAFPVRPLQDSTIGQFDYSKKDIKQKDIKQVMNNRRTRYKDKFKDAETFRKMFRQEFDLYFKK